MLDKESLLVLIVDDDRTMRSLLNLAMEEEGYSVAEAANGEQCLAEYEHFQPDVILLDAVMPGIDGFTCCEKIRSLPEGDKIPILMITVLDDQDSVEQAFQAGATDYITKPIHWSVLAKRVSSLLANRKTSTKLTSVQKALNQEKSWSQLVSSIVGQINNNSDSTKLLNSLHLIRQWSGSSRVCLSEWDSSTYLESAASNYLTIKEIFSDNVNFLAKNWEQLLERKPIFIDSIYLGNFTESQIKSLERLNTHSILIVPIIKKNKIFSYLELHFSGDLPKGQFSEARLLDLANLLVLTDIE